LKVKGEREIFKKVFVLFFEFHFFDWDRRIDIFKKFFNIFIEIRFQGEVNHEDKTTLVVVDRMGGIFLGISLIVVRAKSLVDAILDLQFRIPQDPVALFGNILAIVSALFLVFVKLKSRKGKSS
jgi:hypothetical protein